MPFFLIAGPAHIESRWTWPSRWRRAMKEICCRTGVRPLQVQLRQGQPQFRVVPRGHGPDVGFSPRSGDRSACRSRPTSIPRRKCPAVAGGRCPADAAFLAGRPTSSTPSPSRGKPEHQEGPVLAPGDMKNVVAKAREANAGADNIMVCERGASFGYNSLVPTCAVWRSCARRLPVLDATHFGAAARRQGPSPAVSASSCRCWRAPRWRSGRRPVHGNAPVPEKAFRRSECWRALHGAPAETCSRRRWSEGRGFEGSPGAFDFLRGGGIVAGLNSEERKFMSAIVDVGCPRDFDSRGNPTVEADVLLESGVMGVPRVPSGASTGSSARPSSCAMAMPPAIGQGRCRPSRTSTPRLPKPSSVSMPKSRPSSTDPDRARRYRTTKSCSAPTPSWPCRWPSPRRRPKNLACRCTAISAVGADGDAGADDERHQRRRARQQLPDIQE